MVMAHNQMAYVAIVSTMIFGSLFVGASGYFQTSEDLGGFESAADEDVTGGGTNALDAIDSDNDGISDTLEETQYGTDPNNPDTDGDGLGDGWEIEHGLDPLDNGEPDDISSDPREADTDEAEIEEETNGWPDPDDGPSGDPDRDGLINSVEQELGTDPRRADTDNDGLNDRWESMYTHDVTTPTGDVTMFDPLSGNWDCLLLTTEVELDLENRYDGKEGRADWADLANAMGDYSCDMVLDSDADGLANFEEERYGTNPTLEDSDGDFIADIVEISAGIVTLKNGTADDCMKPLVNTIQRMAPFSQQATDHGLAWFLEDMDEDGYQNGPSDWDTDGDGMPDGYEYCYSNPGEHPLGDSPQAREETLDPANLSDAWGDWDDDGLNNVEEFQVSLIFGPLKFTSPWKEDTDNDGMPDGWEASNGLDPRNGANGDEDPDRDGYDVDGDGSVTYPELILDMTIISIDVELDDQVVTNQTLARGQVTQSGGNRVTVPIIAPVDGFVNQIDVQIGDIITTRLEVMMIIVEVNERFTNLMEYNARDSNGDGVVDSRSTDPLDPDTDNDGLKDGIEVMGWEILVVNRGVNRIWVTSNPGDYDSDDDGLSDWTEFSELCAQGSNASNDDTDGDGLKDNEEAGGDFEWYGVPYFTDPCMFDTDNDGLEDGEEVTLGQDNYYTHANDSDTDDDGLIDGEEVLNIPRPWQYATNPIINDTDEDGMLDGWEMQVLSVEENSRSHSLWVATDIWLPPGCDSMVECGKDPGGWLWQNWVGRFYPIKKYEIHEMNLTNFAVPENSLCNCYGRWALDPNSPLSDSGYDVDNDSLTTDAEGPGRWDTNPVDDDTDGDGLPDGWEVKFSLMALELGLVSNDSETGSRGLMDPSMYDSDLDGIGDGSEDLDSDGLDRSGLIKKYCPGYNDPTNSRCHIDPDTPDGQSFYDNLENYTNFEEFQNGTYPISNDTDGDGLEDGPEVYYQDHDDDGMATGWEYHFEFDPYDAADRLLDTDGDGHVNYCEYKWDTNPRDSTSFPDQLQDCDIF